MPTVDPSTTMQPISAPILVPGTQQEPTAPAAILLSSSGTDLNMITSPTSASFSSDESIAASPTSTGGQHHLLPHPRTSFSGASRPILSGSASSHKNSLNNVNANSGLGRFPSIGNTKKLSVENMTLKAKISELERYLTGVKEELILANRQVHTYRSQIKAAQEQRAIEIHEMTRHVQRCEVELGAKVVECELLEEKLDVAHQRLQLQQQEVEEEEEEKKNENDQRGALGTTTTTKAAPAQDSDSRKNMEQQENDQIKALQEENKRKDATIVELRNKVDRLGTEVLNLEREKACLERPATPTSDSPAGRAETPLIAPAPAAPNKPKTRPTRSNTVISSASLKGLVPITAQAIIAATTPSSTMHSLDNISHSRSPSQSLLHQQQQVQPKTFSSSSSDSSLRTSGSSSSFSASSVSSTTTNGYAQDSIGLKSLVNSVGYDLSVEHPKLLAKFQALRLQHAQASEYVDDLENENRELKVQLLDVSTSF
ncbi:hypothetical protein EDD11_009053 [Mortierella claussenii]|nr:hypothetical protein EDD11_009053 [Mortierella claussenii]